MNEQQLALILAIVFLVPLGAHWGFANERAPRKWYIIPATPVLLYAAFVVIQMLDRGPVRYALGAVIKETKDHRTMHSRGSLSPQTGTVSVVTVEVEGETFEVGASPSLSPVCVGLSQGRFTGARYRSVVARSHCVEAGLLRPDPPTDGRVPAN